MSQSQRRTPDIASFFIRSQPNPQVIPKKRNSPSTDSHDASGRPNKARSPTPKTPAASRFKDATASPFKSPFSLASAKSLSMPIRSPRSGKTLTNPTYGHGPLFNRQDSSKGSSPIPPCPQKNSPSPERVIPTTARTILEDGKPVVVLDSDEDSESLESLEDIFGRRRDNSAITTSSPPEADDTMQEAERKKTLSLFTRGRSDPLVGKEKLRALIAQQKAAKFNIASLMEDHFDDDEIEKNLAKAREGYEASSRESKEWREEQGLDRRLLASVVKNEDGEDNMTRLMDAVERTEVFASESSFCFFGPAGLTDWVNEEPANIGFPENVPLENLWPLRDEDARDRAYLSGFVSEAALRDRVHDSILGWTFDKVVLERRDELRQSYVRCLENVSLVWTRTNITASDVQNMFQVLGANKTVLRDGSDVETKPTWGNPIKRDPKYLLSALELFRGIARDMDFTALSKLTSLLARLAMDAETMNDTRISFALEEALSSLLELPDQEMRHHVAERLLTDIGPHVKQAELQIQLLNHILPASAFAAKVRILLAKRFLLGPSAMTSIESDRPPISLSALTRFLHSTVFHTTGQTRHDTVDYANLKAVTDLLDIAISDGGRPHFSSRADEVAFNRKIDFLADRVKSIFSSIADTGASHMRRTEAKETLQALYYRLLYAVRTEPRPKRNVFGGRDGEEYRAEERSQGFLKKFLAKKKEASALKERNGNTDINMDHSEGSMRMTEGC